jgi:hypothetical protein
VTKETINDESMVDPNHGRHNCAEPERCVDFDDRGFENLEREAGCGSCRGLPSQLQLSIGPSLLYDCERRLWLLPFGHTVLRAGELVIATTQPIRPPDRK